MSCRDHKTHICTCTQGHTCAWTLYETLSNPVQCFSSSCSLFSWSINFPVLQLRLQESPLLAAAFLHSTLGSLFFFFTGPSRPFPGAPPPRLPLTFSSVAERGYFVLLFLPCGYVSHSGRVIYFPPFPGVSSTTGLIASDGHEQRSKTWQCLKKKRE